LPTPRFSVLAGGCVAVLAASGVLQAWLQLGNAAGLYDTGYGRVVLGKVAALLALLGMGWFARRRWVPEVSDTAARLRRHFAGRRWKWP